MNEHQRQLILRYTQILVQEQLSIREGRVIEQNAVLEKGKIQSELGLEPGVIIEKAKDILLGQ